MAEEQPTRWTLIRAAAGGAADARAAFAEAYGPVARAYLAARWRRHALRAELDDALQEVFVDCFKEHGALERADPERGGFRAFLHGVVRNVALRFESGRAREREREEAAPLHGVEADEDSLARVFDRAWARSIVQLAARRQAEAAADESARRRVELLRLRFEDDLPIRAIAARWGADPTRVHREYARAREEYRAALRDVVHEHHGGMPKAVDAECARILGLLA
ncbi:MAG: sigma-70 family RNA polymerase sigma factor [Planctomycetota bacterium]|nr:sigma-70 family RNA polymerase sigma factor [Planctomycetota bacterium]